jgi:hypothetical protein
MSSIISCQLIVVFSPDERLVLVLEQNVAVSSVVRSGNHRGVSTTAVIAEEEI